MTGDIVDTAMQLRPGVLYAAQVEGHRPYEVPDALSLPPHPRFSA